VVAGRGRAVPRVASWPTGAYRGWSGRDPTRIRGVRRRARGRADRPGQGEGVVIRRAGRLGPAGLPGTGRPATRAGGGRGSGRLLVRWAASRAELRDVRAEHGDLGRWAPGPPRTLRSTCGSTRRPGSLAFGVARLQLPRSRPRPRLARLRLPRSRLRMPRPRPRLARLRLTRPRMVRLRMPGSRMVGLRVVGRGVVGRGVVGPGVAGLAGRPPGLRVTGAGAGQSRRRRPPRSPALSFGVHRAGSVQSPEGCRRRGSPGAGRTNGSDRCHT